MPRLSTRKKGNYPRRARNNIVDYNSVCFKVTETVEIWLLYGIYSVKKLCPAFLLGMSSWLFTFLNVNFLAFLLSSTSTFGFLTLSVGFLHFECLGSIFGFLSSSAAMFMAFYHQTWVDWLFTLYVFFALVFSWD